MAIGLLIPALLGLLLMAAHFLHTPVILNSALVPLVGVVASVLAIALLFMRSAWAARVLQGMLILGAAEYVRRVFDMLNEYAAEGRPTGRMVVIMASVIGFLLVAALLFRTRPLRRHFRMESAGE